MPRKKLFHFEEMWLTNPRCGETVEAAWLLGGGGGKLQLEGFYTPNISAKIDKVDF